MIGTEDRITNIWAQFVKKYSFLPLLGDGSTKYVWDSFELCVAAYFAYMFLFPLFSAFFSSFFASF